MAKLGYEVEEKPVPSETTVADTISDDSKKVPVKTTAIIDEEKKLLELRKELDKGFIQLDRLLSIAEEKEEEFDFPVAFISNLLYICEKNGLRYMLEDGNKPVGHEERGNNDEVEDEHDRLRNSRRLQSFLKVLKKKQDYMHIEGLGHSIYALDRLGYYEDTELWASLLAQIENRKTENFLVEYVKDAGGGPRSFDYIGEKGGFPNKTRSEHVGQ